MLILIFGIISFICSTIFFINNFLEDKRHKNLYKEIDNTIKKLDQGHLEYGEFLKECNKFKKLNKELNKI